MTDIIQYRIPATVDRVERKREILRGWKGADGNDDFEYGPWRWFVHFSGSYESLCFGDDKPPFEVGDVVDIIFRPRPRPPLLPVLPTPRPVQPAPSPAPGAAAITVPLEP